MSVSDKIRALDLTREFPRSPAQELGGYVLLARIIDKCRATIAGTNGEYKYNCSIDKQFFDFTGINAEELQSFIAGGATDEEIAGWVNQHAEAHSETEVLTWCYEQRTREPLTAEQKAYYEKLRRNNAPGKLYVRTWMEVLDAEEGRI